MTEKSPLAEIDLANASSGTRSGGLCCSLDKRAISGLLDGQGLLPLRRLAAEHLPDPSTPRSQHK
jgi:hypothetical protein